MKALKWLIITALLAASVVYGVYANEARKEVYFLCGNFTPGNKLPSVIRQLDTVTLSTYQMEDQNMGKHIVLSSALTWRLSRCHIEVDHNGVVTRAGYESP